MALVLSLSLPFSLSLPLDLAPPPRLIGELVQLKTGTGTLHGIIDLPARRGPWPVVILHAGSGPTDRDGNGPFVRTDNLKILGRTLAAGGVAVLRIDKRGVGASSKALAKEEDARLETYAADVAAWAARLREDPRFTKLGLIGHSEGALIGLIAAKDAKPDAYVSLCGPGRPLQEVLREQLKKNLPEDLYKASDTIVADLEAGREVKDVPKGLASLFRPSVQPFLISAFKHDPAKLVAEFSGPVLVVSGSTDIQVSSADAKRLGGGNAKAKVVTVDGMNHVLKVVEGTHRVLQLASYSDPTLPLHPKLVPELAVFLKETLGGK
jgi:pimeloyl-ACP methyl ester carboxylesterase